jgi:hypothetical protein
MNVTMSKNFTTDIANAQLTPEVDSIIIPPKAYANITTIIEKTIAGVNCSS